MCPGLPFGIFSIGACDGGVTYSTTLSFFSDGGASIAGVDANKPCAVDRLDCELLLTCTDIYQSQLSLDWTPAAERLSGVWKSSSVPQCVELQKK